MEQWVPFGCPEDACKDVQTCPGFREKFGRVAARPWNQHEPRATMWWLVPFDEAARSPWPAYAVGKYQFAFSGDRKRIQVGLHVEKGLSAEAAGMLTERGKALKMTPDWRWYRFVADLRSGIVASTLGEVSRRQRIPLQVRVYGGPPERLYEDVSERVVFEVRDGRLAAFDAPTRTKLLPPLQAVTSGPDLADALSNFPRGGWVWVDLRVMTSFALGPATGLAAGDEWSGERLWEGLLSPLAKWVSPRFR